MKTIIFSCLLLCNSFVSSAQTDSILLLNEAISKLQNKSASVSTILTGKKYVPIHPLTAFRELIKAKSTADVLAIATADEPGKKIRVLGMITGKDGKPAAGALIYLYQTDARGWYAADAPHVLRNEGDMRHARLFGYVKTDEAGKFELHTVKPSGYPHSNLPAHIHVHITGGGYQSTVTELLFDDDERLICKIREDAVRNKFIIAKPEKAVAPFEQQFSYTLILKNE